MNILFLGNSLIFYNDITDAEKFEKIKECPYFYCIFSADEEI